MPLEPSPFNTPATGGRVARARTNWLVAAEVEIEVEFPDLDPMAITWHGHYLRYFESARVALMRKIGYDYPDMQASGFTWPVIEAKLRYVQASRYAQRLRVAAGIEEWECALRIGYLITDAEAGTRITTGYTVQCAVDNAGEMQLGTPDALRKRLEKFL
ncbi:MAG TPA: acyl-CoA thioesterase [Gammaproteobacteria bacterium]|nr:acyl-CoA thioesterase [Gammaproteobacteria bacterium]